MNVSRLDSAFNRVFPSGEELWKARNASMRPVDVNGNTLSIPVFPLEVTSLEELSDTEFRDKQHGNRKIGREIMVRIGINEVLHAGRVLIPDDELRHPAETDFAFNRSTAFTTTIHGYAERGTKDIVARTHRPFIQTGAKYSGHTELSAKELLRVPQTVWDGWNQSLFEQSQTRYMMHELLTNEYDLPQRFAMSGDSMSTMNQSAMFGYDALRSGVPRQQLTAEQSKIIGFYAKGRCVLDKIEAKDLPLVGKWFGKTVLGGLAAGLCVAREGDFDTIVGTASINPNFNASAMTGTLRAVASGEAGYQIRFIPRDAGGVEVHYGSDDLSDGKQLKEYFEDYPNVRYKRVARGTHGAIIHPLADRGRTEWAARLSDAYDRANGQIGAMNWNYINGIAEVDLLTAQAA